MEETLAQVEILLSSFYGTGPTKETETHLTACRNHPGVWHSLGPHLAASQSPFSRFFACLLFEDAANNHWASLSDGEKAHLFSLCERSVVSNRPSSGSPWFVLGKAITATVACGRAGWPGAGCQGFLATVLGWAGADDADTRLVGLEAIKVMSEEFMGGRGAVTVERREALKGALTAEMPGVMAAIFGSLETVARACLPFSNPREGFFAPPPPLSATHPAESRQAVSALNALSHLVSWVPLRDHVPATLYDMLFLFSWINGPEGIAALSCVDSILSRNYFPREFGAFVQRVFEHQMLLLQRLAEAGPGAVASLDEGYVQKLTFFIHIFVESHLRRLLADPRAAVDTYFSLLYGYTFSHGDNPQAFFDCVDVWGVFLEDMTERLESGGDGARDELRPILAKFEAGLLILFDALLARTRFASNPRLASMDDSDRDEETGLTERGRCIASCCSVLQRLITVYFEPCVAKVAADFGATLATYRGASLSLLASQASSSQVSLVFKDVATSLRLVNMTAPKFCEVYDLTYSTALSTLTAVLDLAEFTIEHQQQQQQQQPGSPLIGPMANPAANSAAAAAAVGSPRPVADQARLAFVKHSAQVLQAAIGCLHSFLQWLSLTGQRYREGAAAATPPSVSQAAAAQAQDFPAVISRIVGVVATLISPTTTPSVALAAAVFLSSMVSSVRPSFLLTIPAMGSLVNEVHIRAAALPSADAAYALYKAVSGALVQYVVAGPNAATVVAGGSGLSNSISTATAAAVAAAAAAGGGAGGAGAGGHGSPALGPAAAVGSPHLGPASAAPAIDLDGPSSAAASSLQKEREAVYVVSFCQGLLADYKAMLAGTVPFNADVIVRTMKLLHALVSSVHGEGAASKALVYSSFAELLAPTLLVLSRSLSSAAVLSEVSNLFVLLFDAMPALVGPAFMQEALSALVGGFGGSLDAVLASADETGQRALMRFLELLGNVARDRGSRAVLPGLLAFCVDSLFPKARASELAEDVVPALYQVFFHCLDTHWKHLEGTQGLAHHHAAMISLICGGISQHAEPSLCRAVLQYVAELDEHHRLLRSKAFAALAPAYCSALLSAIIDKTHASLREELTESIFKVMVVVSLPSFTTQFLPGYLSSLPGLEPAEATAIAERFGASAAEDLPTFEASISKLVDDVEFIRAVRLQQLRKQQGLQ